MYAIIESCGRQYKVAEGDVVFFEKLEGEEGKKVTFDNVVLVSNDSKVEVGAPYVKGVKVEGKVVSHGKGKKILVYKYKAKKNYTWLIRKVKVVLKTVEIVNLNV